MAILSSQDITAPVTAEGQLGILCLGAHPDDCDLRLAGMALKYRALGHRVKLVPPLEGACSVAAIRVLENGVRAAGSDPRRDGWAAAY